MSIPRREVLGLLTGAAALLARSSDAGAQSYPTRPITMVAPFPAGGAVDTIGRLLAERMQGSLGQAVIVENVSGAAGSVGPGRVARAPADGYTLSLGTSGTHVLNAATMTLQYDVLNDFEPIALLSTRRARGTARRRARCGARRRFGEQVAPSHRTARRSRRTRDRRRGSRFPHRTGAARRATRAPRGA
jgi:hypothetical protein